MFRELLEKISPYGFYTFSSYVIPWALLISFFLISYSFYNGLFVAPSDYQQGDAYRIMYVHVPSAWLSLFSYTVLFF